MKMTTNPDEILLDSALAIFREQGFAGATLEAIAQRASLDAAALRKRYPTVSALLNGLLTQTSPLDLISQTLREVEGEDAEDILRNAYRQAVAIFDQNPQFIELATIDAQFNNGAYLSSFTTALLPQSLALLGRLKDTGQLRPVSDPVLGRTFVALLMGFIVSERALPSLARFAMRIVPQRAWLDGMVDLLLYGVLEDDAR